MAISRFTRVAGASVVAGATTLVVWALTATPAVATGSYPGETLTLAVQGSSISGHETQFVATGQDGDVADYPGGFSLEVFAKNTSVDPTCSDSYIGEEQAEVSDQYEQQIVTGEPEGQDTSFSVPFKYVFPGTGSVTLCAYSTWVTDTAASASLKIDVLPAGSAAKPINTKRPAVSRSGRTLKCSRGAWQNATSYAYSWSVGGRTRKGANSSKLRIARRVKGHSVVCRVTASNSAGATTASSRALRVH